MRRTKASILVGLLWCLALLSVVVIGVLHTARLDLFVVKNYGDRIQAHYLALAGIEKAQALLYQEAKNRSRSRISHSGELYNSAQAFRDVALGRGHFQVFRRGRSDEGGGIIYGVSDEESRLNVNYAATDELARLSGMTPDIVAAILDWRDEDDEVTPGGAEAEYYSSLQPPSLPRNGLLQTIRELLMVRGVSNDVLLGNDLDQNGLLNSEGDDRNSVSSEDQGGVLEDAGWSALLTVDSSVKNMSAAGEDRVNVQTADESSLTGVKGITPEIAKAIVAYRGQNELKSVADLLDVTAQNQNQSRSGGNQTAQNNPPGTAPAGPKVVNDTLLMDIADDVTTAKEAYLPGVININSASLDVLTCLPGLNRDLAQAIISYRQSSGFLPNIAWLLKVPGITRDIFKQVAPRVSARSETFRIVSEGRVDSTGARQRIQVIVNVGLHNIATLSYREDL
jgi:DNA uptake protein ComE-like DNA-binding protein